MSSRHNAYCRLEYPNNYAICTNMRMAFFYLATEKRQERQLLQNPISTFLVTVPIPLSGV